MLLGELLTALVLTMLLVGLFGLALGRGYGPWGGMLWFFVIVFLGAWAIGSWATPVGPVYLGVAWVPFFVGALVFTLLLAAFADPRPRRAATTPPESEEQVALSAFFGGFLVLMVLTIAAGIY